MPSKVNPKFYNSKRWRNLERIIYERDEGKCQMCGEHVEMIFITTKHGGYYRIHGAVDHIVELNETNINNPEIAYGENNLQLLCHDCHNTKTFKKPRTAQGLRFDENGDLVKE